MIGYALGWLVGRFGLVATAAFLGGVVSFSYILFTDAPVPASVQAIAQAHKNCPVPELARWPLQKIGVLHVAGKTCQFHWVR